MKAVGKYKVTQTCNWARDLMANNDFITQASKFLMEFIARRDNSGLFVIIYQRYTCCSLYFSYRPCVIVRALREVGEGMCVILNPAMLKDDKTLVNLDAAGATGFFVQPNCSLAEPSSGANDPLAFNTSRKRCSQGRY
jgi:hypothetical protein